MKRIVLIGGILLSVALIWFAGNNYDSSGQIAKENLRGLALSLAAAIENIALHDPSLRSLGTFHSHDIAYFALIDRNGLYRFHSNPDLIGTRLQHALPLLTIQNGVTSDARITLRTGENVFEFNAPIYLPSEILSLQLTLHTYRADTVIRRARLNLVVLLCLLMAGWILSAALYRFTRREEQHKLEIAQKESLAQLGEMGAMLAHEIRNPLAGIKGYAQVIGKKPQDERNSGFADRIVVEAHRLEILVNDLLAYAKSDRASMDTVDLAELIIHTGALLRYEAEPLHIKIVCESPKNMFVVGRRDRLGQILINLGKNAIQAMPDGGTINITAEVVGKQAIIRVNDSGLGISQEDLPSIFEPFFTTKARGTGLGLALCRKVVEEHGGQITVDSLVGQGTSVSITIPIRKS